MSDAAAPPVQSPPPRPQPPADSDCCRSDCALCVFTLYERELERWLAAQAAPLAEARP